MIRRVSQPLALLIGCLLLVVAAGGAAQQADPARTADPFAVLHRHLGRNAALVPPRALAVIPERNTNRLVRIVDVLVAIDPQFDEVATAAGLDGQRAIQLRTREARVPIFVAKSESTIATLLQLPLGARVEVRGVLVPQGTRYLLLAAEVRQAPAARRAR